MGADYWPFGICDRNARVLCVAVSAAADRKIQLTD
jgi:hypothetical protein